MVGPLLPVLAGALGLLGLEGGLDGGFVLEAVAHEVGAGDLLLGADAEGGGDAGDFEHVGELGFEVPLLELAEHGGVEAGADDHDGEGLHAGSFARRGAGARGVWYISGDGADAPVRDGGRRETVRRRTRFEARAAFCGLTAVASGAKADERTRAEQG